MPFTDMKGKKFERLKVLKLVSSIPQTKWLCRCDCGNEREVYGNNLRSGKTKSCGCLSREITSKRSLVHGACCNAERHPLYRIWSHMKDRCYDKDHKSYPDYGGRGIKIFKEWLNDYSAFRDYMVSLPGCPSSAEMPGVKMDKTIDRIKNNQNYRPGNVRWATLIQQCNNKRANVYHIVKGVKMTLREATSLEGTVSYKTAKERIRRNWHIEKALYTPLSKNSGRPAIRRA